MNKNFPVGSWIRHLRWICVSLMVLACASLSLAQTLPDAPVLISEENSTRALAVEPSSLRMNRLPLTGEPLWHAGQGTRVTFFVTNLDLMAGEGANAFRADATTETGRRYNLPVVSLRPISNLSWIYAITLELNPELGDAGDVLVRLNWRGMASNRVRLSIGHIGGGISDDEGVCADACAALAAQAQVGDRRGRIGSHRAPDAA